MTRRVVITGLGLTTPIGVGKEAFWAAAQAGRSGVGRPSLLETMDVPIKVIGEVKDFIAAEHLSKKLVVRSDRNTHFAFASCNEALADAGLDLTTEDKSRIGIVLASNYGGTSYYLNNLVRLHQKGPSFVSAYMAIAWIPSAPVGQLSIFHGITGYTRTYLNDIAGGLDAIGNSCRAIRRGDADVIISGGFEAVIAEASMATMSTFTELCHDASDPATAYRPFDRDRHGSVVAEGGGIVILEELERALARGAQIYGEIVGYAQSTDALDFHSFAPDGKYYARAMHAALHEAGLTPDSVDYFNADGRSTANADQAEANALKVAFGDHLPNLAVSAPKSMTGSMLAGAGPVDVAFAALAMRDNLVPPTINVDHQDPACAINLVISQPRATPISTAMIGARGTGGGNSVLVLKELA